MLCIYLPSYKSIFVLFSPSDNYNPCLKIIEGEVHATKISILYKISDAKYYRLQMYTVTCLAMCVVYTNGYRISGKFQCKKKLRKVHTSTKLKHTRFIYYDNFTFE